ncbi:MAG: ABC transporter ATP-binding protein [Patescibacteria group bacterium]
MINAKSANHINLKGVGKKFNLSPTKKEGILFKCLNLFSAANTAAKDSNGFWALKDINLVPQDGKIIGIIGCNGSGKSTLLRIMAGIYQLDEGKISIGGEVVYITSFGQGLMPKLTMKENIYLVGSLLNLNQKEIKQRFDEIVEFSELKDYVNTKVYKFSSGMISRLSFSATIYCVKHKNPEIILIDEALEAGADLNFKNKAIKKVEELIKGGATVILVSHELELINRFCDWVLWLDKGRIFKEGLPQEIISEYIKTNA